MYVLRRELDAIDELDQYLRSRPMAPDRLRALVYLSTGDLHLADLAQANLIREHERIKNGSNRRIATKANSGF